MPTRLVDLNPKAIARNRERAVELAKVEHFAGASPWLGYLPDVNNEQLGLSATRQMFNLVPRDESLNTGEVLTHAPGYEELDATTQLGSGTDRHVVRLDFFARTGSSGDRAGENELTTMAVTAGDGSTPGSGRMYRVRPTTGLWQEIAASADIASADLTGHYPDGTSDSSLGDSATFPAGAPNRTYGSGNIATPVWVYCNNKDPVTVYPAAGLENDVYETLGDSSGVFGTASGAFIAASCESWAGRMNYLNTVENGIRYRQRLRRSAIGTADPDVTLAGSGALDFREFSEDGLRCETLGDFLACYFGDGIAFVKSTSNSEAPYAREIITTTRGLLGPQSLANLGDGRHFGIFNDGWYYLDQAGQFTELGLAEVEGTVTTKWKKTFYNRIDMNLRGRIACHYDQHNSWIWITLPLDNEDENSETWIYDMLGDRVFPLPIEVTCFASINQLIKPSETFADLTGSFAEQTGTFSDYGPDYGVKTLIHGVRTGRVNSHSSRITTQIDPDTGASAQPVYDYKTVLTSLQTPRFQKTAQEVYFSHLWVSNTTSDITITVHKADETSESATIAINPDGVEVPSVVILNQWFRVTSTHLGLEFTGTGPIIFDRFGVDVRILGTRRRRAVAP